MSTRSLARATGISFKSVHRILQSQELKPHRVRTVKISNDPHFVEKVIDIVGLHLNSPEQALVLCADEMSQIQALDRTQRRLPMKKGRAKTATHDYRRHGPTTLFAAIELLTGNVVSQCMLRHRHQEWLKFLQQIDEEMPQWRLRADSRLWAVGISSSNPPMVGSRRGAAQCRRSRSPRVPDIAAHRGTASSGRDGGNRQSMPSATCASHSAISTMADLFKFGRGPGELRYD